MDLANFDIEAFTKRVIAEITSKNEENRRAEHQRRHDIYKGKGKPYLLERLRREFDEDAIKEMRIFAINILKKVINSKSIVYEMSPVRIAEDETDQAIMDYYIEELDLDENMQKANRFLNLHSNVALYPLFRNNKIKLKVQGAHEFSVVPHEDDLSEPKAFVFSSFDWGKVLFSDREPASATGAQAFSTNRGAHDGGLVDSNEQPQTKYDENSRFIFWLEQFHWVANGKGLILLDEKNPNHLNPWEQNPVVFITKDRDNETWSEERSDTVDLALDFMVNWCDALTILKHQGYGQLLAKGPESPQYIKMGINKAIYLKHDNPELPESSLEYLSTNLQIDKHLEINKELLSQLLYSQDVDPTGAGSVSFNPTSGFQVLLLMAPMLRAAKRDRPHLKKGELELWQKIKVIHNWAHKNNLLSQEARNLGTFSEQFAPSVTYNDVKPIENESEVLDNLSKRKSLGLYSRSVGMKRLYPYMSDEQIEDELQAIDEENSKRMEESGLPTPTERPAEEVDQGEESETEGAETDANAGASSNAA